MKCEFFAPGTRGKFMQLSQLLLISHELGFDYFQPYSASSSRHGLLGSSPEYAKKKGTSQASNKSKRISAKIFKGALGLKLRIGN